MKREIKFRAWREWDRRMVYDDICICLSFQDDGVINQCSSVAMQFTGLHDCNGKEIYEGDIVATEMEDGYSFGSGERKTYRAAVEWSDGHWYCGFGNFKNCNVGALYASKAAVIEVIGNIYENPELLQR